jgi:hypothetical protein
MTTLSRWIASSVAALLTLVLLGACGLDHGTVTDLTYEPDASFWMPETTCADKRQHNFGLDLEMRRMRPTLPGQSVGCSRTRRVFHMV